MKSRLLTLPLAVASASLLAQEVPQAEYELVTTAIHTRRSETALPVTVLSGDELRDAARATLGDTLANQPGINNSSFGPAVGQTVIRGQQGRRVMHLTNGIPNADASGNSADHALTVEPILARTLEVLRGPSTLLYGGGAIGGVVNVIDDRIPRTLTEDPVLQLEARHDTAADQDNLIGRLDFATGNVSWHADALRRDWNDLEIPGFAVDPALLEAAHDHEEGEEEEHEEEEIANTFGHVANSGGKTESGTIGASYVFAGGFLGFSASRLENRYGLPSGAHDHGHGHDEEEHEEGDEEHQDEAHGAHDVSVDMVRTRYDLSGEWRDLAPWVENLRYSLSWSDYRHEELEGGEAATRFDNESVQHRLQLTHPELWGWHGVLGWQGSRGEFGAIGEESFIPLTDLRSDGVFLVEDYHLNRLTLELGARLGRDEVSPKDAGLPTRDFSTHSLSASALFDISAPVSLGVSWSRSERAPSVEELYSNHALAAGGECVIHFATGACEVGDSTFGTEKSTNTDLSLYLEHGDLNATLTVFYNAFDDYIFQAETGLEADGFPVREYRQTDATFRGVELDVGYRLNDFVELSVFADTIDGELDGHGNAPRLPPARVGSTLQVEGLRWSGYVSVLRALEQDEPGLNEAPTPGYTRWDMGVDYTMETGARGELTLFAKGRNLGDEEIRLSTSYLRNFAPEAGRSVEVGLRYQF